MATVKRKTAGYVTESLRGAKLKELSWLERLLRTFRFTKLELWGSGFALAFGTVALVVGIFELNRLVLFTGDPNVDGRTVADVWTEHGNFNGVYEVMDWGYFGGMAAVVCGVLLYFFVFIAWVYVFWKKTVWPMWYLVFVWLGVIVTTGAVVFSLTVALAIFA